MTQQQALNLLEQYNRELLRTEGRAIARINSALDSSYKALETKLKESYNNYQSLALLPNQQRAVILADLGELLKVVDPAFEGQVDNLLKQAIAQGEDVASGLVSALAPDSFVRQFNSVPIGALRVASTQSYQLMLRHGLEFADRSTALIQQSLIQGWGTQKLARELRNELGILKFRAETIARTETIRALNQAALSRYDRTGVEFVQLVAVGKNSCPLCLGRNGGIYRRPEPRIFPFHPRCRCYLMPYKRDWDSNPDFMENYRLEQLKKEKVAPDMGATYWEKQAGWSAPERIKF